MGATFSRVKNWAASETLTRADLNAEFDNILNYLTPSGVDDYSTNASAMQTQTDPGSVGAESLATSLAGEIERLRFAIKRIAGETYWYTAPDSSIAELTSALGGGLPTNRIASGRSSSNSSQSLFLVPHGTNRTVNIQGATTNFVYYINGTQYTISSNVTSGTLTAAPSSNNTCLVNDTTLAAQSWTKQLGEFGTSITVDAMGSEISALVGKLAGFKTSTEYFIAKVESTTSLTKAQRGYFFDSADAALARVGLTDNDTITLMKLTWVFAKTDGTITVSYTNPRVGKDEPGSPAIGDYWFDTSVNYWKYYDSSNFVSAGAMLVGICLQDSSGTKAARGFDYFKNYSSQNSIEIEKISATEVRARDNGGELNVFGTTLRFPVDVLRWDITTDRDTGISESASTTYYCYVKENGDTVLSTVAPMERSSDLKGLYHPYETWRAVGEFFNDSSSDITLVCSYLNFDYNKYGLTASVSGNALTMIFRGMNINSSSSISPVYLYFRDATSATGSPVKRLIANPIKTVISSGSTAGFASATTNYINWYLIDNAGTIELAWSGTWFDSGTIVTTSAEGGAGAADSSYTMFSTSARTNVACLFIGRTKHSLTTAGTWNEVPDEISLAPCDIKGAASKIQVHTGNGHGSTNTKIRKFSTVQHNLGNAMTLTQSGTDGDSITINVDGNYSFSYSDYRGAATSFGLTLNSTALTTNIDSCDPDILIATYSPVAGNERNTVAWSGHLKVGDIVRAHTDGTPGSLDGGCRLTATHLLGD